MVIFLIFISALPRFMSRKIRMVKFLLNCKNKCKNNFDFETEYESIRKINDMKFASHDYVKIYF